jgi:hypothetical protein
MKATNVSTSSLIELSTYTMLCLMNSLFLLQKYLPRLCLLHAWTATPAFGYIFLPAGSTGSISPSTSPGAGPALHSPIASAPPRTGHTLHGSVASAAPAQPAAPTSQVAASGPGPTELGAPPSVSAVPGLHVVPRGTGSRTTSTHPFAITPVNNAHAMRTRGKSGVWQPVDRLELPASILSLVPKSVCTTLLDANWRSAMQVEYHYVIDRTL